MRLLSIWAGLAPLLLVACGFDNTAPVSSSNPMSGGAGGNVSAGGSSSGGGGMPSGTSGSSGAGQASGGSSITPEGGSTSQAGMAGSGGTPAGGSGGSNGGGNGGSAGSGGSSSVNPHYKLAWRDDFNTFDSTRWTKQTHTFAENLARFSVDNVVVEGGLLKLRVTKVPNGDRDYSAAEVASKDLFTYGRFAGRIMFCPGKGMVSSLFTYHDDVNTSWEEIDIEHLGYLPKAVQYNLISGTLNNRVYQPKVVNLQFSPPTEFHDYSIEWAPDGITFFVDGTQTHHDTQASIKNAARLHMNAWPTNNAVTSFAGTFDPAAVPCEAQYDWVEAYTYVP